ncbi:hypothetical protein HanXRQr2_Chr13g0610561 [Helianthus annuus]|uniref:Uncharacterized protein n=1 Tax=Helianthus annuus TaxID=4232 RepID=A0A9K3HCH5_HELAN|nr:hypothetical protein HanXRQr2_Chr13g0610561 [Helianthus annuus]KAJ0483234.1 hypothetical protein HanIR_Chr13g0662661 [Helianthus annuus]KAJ0499360.1 hypothetical protein HanHA89_Chr13g0533231 [Helianthus annuus]KAJ0665380.1 hypothetical protein HanLR1_Chr13g0503321 [Helianthus annuus]
MRSKLGILHGSKQGQVFGRNEKEFNGNFIPIDRMVEDIKANTFLWIRSRSKYEDLISERWRDFNMRDIIM